MQSTLSSRVLKTELIDWKNLQFIQQESFKELPPDAKQQLKNSILKNDFTQPFYVWQDPADSVIYCLDGKHRTIALEELIKENLHVPDLLPATFIDCKDKQHAAKLVLLYSSAYAQITESGFLDFIKLYDLDAEEIKMEALIPGITDIPVIDMPDELVGIPKNKPATIKITIATVEELERLKPEIENFMKENCEVSYILSVSAGEI